MITRRHHNYATITKQSRFKVQIGVCVCLFVCGFIFVGVCVYLRGEEGAILNFVLAIFTRVWAGRAHAQQRASAHKKKLLSVDNFIWLVRGSGARVGKCARGGARACVRGISVNSGSYSCFSAKHKLGASSSS